VFVNNEKPIDGDRLEASKGGPKTAAGKAAVRLNAVSHGLFAQDLILPGEDRRQLTDLRERFLAEIQPQGEMENWLVERIVSCAWRLKRALRYENNQHKRDTNYRFGHWDTFLRYETTLERQIYKALHELIALQKTRLLWQQALASSSEESETPVEPSSLKVLADLQKFYNRNPELLSD
jgi:hypothetical protein